MSTHRKKKPVELHFVDMNDPERYKKLKVARACDSCRNRKSKCDIGIPGSGTCSNCQKYKMVCIFSPATTRTTDLTPRLEDLTSQLTMNSMNLLNFRFSLLLIKNGQVGYEKLPYYQLPQETKSQQQQQQTSNTTIEPSLQLESTLFNLYFTNFHPSFPILLKQSILNIHSQDRLLLSRHLRFAIMTLACHFYFISSPIPNLENLPFTNSKNIVNYFYQIAKHEITTVSSNRLDTVQSLIMLYKHHEIIGSEEGLHFLEQAQTLMAHLYSVVPQQQEMINRTRWILFSSISLSNLSDKNLYRMYSHIDLPIDLPQPLQEEIDEDSEATRHINRLAQISNLSVLYSHTVQSLMIEATDQLICFEQFQEIRQHWHDTFYPVTLSDNTVVNDTILLLYTAILYDMLYLLLVLHHHIDGDSVDTAYRLHCMVLTWICNPAYISAIQGRRMASFALMLCLQVQFKRENIDPGFIDQIRQTMLRINIDPRLDNEFRELHAVITNKTTSGYLHQPATDYFSLPQRLHPTTTDLLDATPSLWDILSTTSGGLTTPIREEQTTEWIQSTEGYDTIESLNQTKI